MNILLKYKQLGRIKRRLIIALLVPLILFGLFLTADALFPLPMEKRHFATVITGSDGTPLRTFADAQGVWRYPITLDEVSPLYLQALLGYEDRWFYYHPGVNPFAMLRATWQNLRSGRVISGGSTLSMQTARLIDPHSRSVTGKCKQIFRALQLEWHYSKEEILTYYMNQAPFGGTLQGVQAAAYTYLGKSAGELSHAEAALLAVLPQAPSRCRPDRAPQRARQARDKVLNRLATLSIWTRQVVEEAKQEAVFAERYQSPLDCPLLARRLHNQHPKAELLQTTIDPLYQEQLRDLAHQYSFVLPPENSISILVVDNTDMAVKAYVGSADFKSRERFGHVDMVIGLRSPGSTLKPFLYGLALDDGLIHSQSLLSDTPILTGDYRPGNFDQGFSGPVSATFALRHSLNVPAVQLLDAYGPNTFAGRLRNAGMTMSFPQNSQANLAMILGGVGTNLESLVSGYTALARQGRAGKLRYLKDDPLEERFLMSPGAAWIVRDMLRHPFPGQGILHLVQRLPTYAWKTGTSYGYRDAWAIAVSNQYTIGVWIGRPDGTPSPGQYGAATAAPLLLNVLETMDVPVDQLSRPETVTTNTICWPTGLSTARSKTLGLNCYQKRNAWILNDQIPPTLPDPHTPLGDLALPILVNADSGLRVDRACNVSNIKLRKITLWPKAVEPWLPLSWRRESLIPPPDGTCGHMPGLTGSAIRISGLSADSLLANTSDSEKPPVVALDALGGVGRKYWYLNGRPIAVSKVDEVIHYPFQNSGQYQLAVVDEAGNTDMVKFEVIFQ